MLYVSNGIIYQATVSTPVGKIGVRAPDRFLLGIDYLHDSELIITPKTIVAKETVEQLLCYFADPKFPFDLPLMLDVTLFQQSVLDALQKIPVGTTQSYAELAKRLNTKAQPIGSACLKNPIPIIIPCHRLVSKNDLGGYRGSTAKGSFLEIKRWLLQHEEV